METAKLEYIGNDIIDVFRCSNCHAFIIDEDCKECPSCKAIFEENNTCKGCVHNMGNHPGYDDIYCGYIEDHINNTRCEFYEEENKT